MSGPEASIQQITAQQCLDLRSRVLRPGLDIQQCHFAEDNLPTTFHLGAVVNNHIVASGTFMLASHEYFAAANKPYRLRGMATDSEQRGKNLGSQLLHHAEMLLKTLNSDLLWFNARESAFLFYEKNGYVSVGEMFDLPNTGPHKVMYKWL